MAMLDIDGAIRVRAYEFWQAEGELPDRSLDHWLRAEAEIKGLLAPDKKPARKPAAKSAARAKAKA